MSQELKAFIRSERRRTDKLRAGLVVSGGNSQIQHHQLRNLLDIRDDTTTFISLRANQAPNLQTALRNIICQSIETDAGVNAYANFIAVNKALIPMNFDLELLQKFVEKQGIRSVVISMPEAETYDSGVLAELLASLSSWTDRVPFTVLLGIATTVSLFEGRLSKSTIRLLDTASFDFTSKGDRMYDIFCAVQCSPATRLFLSPATINTLSETQQDQSTTISAFVRALKYIHMTHFFANPLSTLLSRPLPDKAATSTLCECVHNTSSFQAYCLSLLEQGRSRTETIRQLLNNDAFLLKTIETGVHEGINHHRRLNERVEQIVRIYKHLHPNSASPLTLHAQLLQSFSSPQYPTDIPDTVLSALRLLPSDTLISTIFAFPTLITTATKSTLTALTTSISKLHTTHSTASIKSTYSNTSQPNSRSIFTSAHTPAPATRAEKDYIAHLDKIVTSLQTYLSQPPTAPAIIASEALIYTNHTLLQRTFQPRPRFAIERALSRPADYLGCDSDCVCCYNPNSAPEWKGKAKERSSRGGDEDRIPAPGRKISKPKAKPKSGKKETPKAKTTAQTTHHDKLNIPHEPTSLLFTLLNEAGRDVNVRDLWDRFAGIMDAGSHINLNAFTEEEEKQGGDTNEEGDDSEGGGDEDDDDDEDEDEDDPTGTHETDESKESTLLCLFYTSLAELKVLGMITSKPTSENTKSIKGIKGMVKGVDVISRVTWSGL